MSDIQSLADKFQSLVQIQYDFFSKLSRPILIDKEQNNISNLTGLAISSLDKHFASAQQICKAIWQESPELFLLLALVTNKTNLNKVRAADVSKFVQLLLQWWETFEILPVLATVIERHHFLFPLLPAGWKTAPKLEYLIRTFSSSRTSDTLPSTQPQQKEQSHSILEPAASAASGDIFVGTLGKRKRSEGSQAHTQPHPQQQHQVDKQETDINTSLRLPPTTNTLGPSQISYRLDISARGQENYQGQQPISSFLAPEFRSATSEKEGSRMQWGLSGPPRPSYSQPPQANQNNAVSCNSQNDWQRVPASQAIETLPGIAELVPSAYSWSQMFIHIEFHGKQPCKRCVSRREHFECIYVAHIMHEKGELVKQIKELKAKNHTIEQILQALSNDKKAPEILDRLKNGKTYESIVEWLGRLPMEHFETLSPSHS